MQRRRYLWLAVMVAATVTPSAVAGEATLSPKAAHFAAPHVMAVAVHRTGGLWWRAIVLDAWSVPEIVIEQRMASPNPAHRRLVDRHRLTTFRFGRGELSFAGHAQDIVALAWEKGRLTFSLLTSDERLRCAVPIAGPDAFVAQCAAPRRTADGAGRAERRTTVAQARDVSGLVLACGRVFGAEATSRACVDVALAATYNPVGVIGLCAAHAPDDDTALACLRAASRAYVDASDVVRGCADATQGGQALVHCLGRSVSF